MFVLPPRSLPITHNFGILVCKMWFHFFVWNEARKYKDGFDAKLLEDSEVRLDALHKSEWWTTCRSEQRLARRRVVEKEVKVM